MAIFFHQTALKPRFTDLRKFISGLERAGEFLLGEGVAT